MGRRGMAGVRGLARYLRSTPMGRVLRGWVCLMAGMWAGRLYAGLILSGNTLYGTAWYGGGSGGTVFAINTDGTGFTSVYSFNGSSDGSYPYAGVILSGNTLYGTARYGGITGHGTVYSLSLSQ